MYKIEIICETCSKHYVIVTQDEKDEPEYCPFCSSRLDEDSDNESWD